MIRCCIPRSAGGDAGESRTLPREDVLLVDSAFASLAEDEGPLDLTPEAHAYTVFCQQALVSVGLGKLWDRV